MDKVKVRDKRKRRINCQQRQEHLEKHGKRFRHGKSSFVRYRSLVARALLFSAPLCDSFRELGYTTIPSFTGTFISSLYLMKDQGARPIARRIVRVVHRLPVNDS